MEEDIEVESKDDVVIDDCDTKTSDDNFAVPMDSKDNEDDEPSKCVSSRRPCDPLSCGIFKQDRN